MSDATSFTLTSMDAGVLGRMLQILFSTPGGSAPLTYGSNGQFQISVGGPAVQGDDPSLGDTDSSREGPFVSDASSLPQVSEAVTGLQATQSHLDQRPESLDSFVGPWTITPSPSQAPKPLATATATSGVYSNPVSALSLSSSLPLRSLPVSRSISLAPLSKSVYMSSSHSVPRSSSCTGYSCSKSATFTILGSSTATSIAELRTATPVVPAKISNLGAQRAPWYFGVILGAILVGGLLVSVGAIFVFSCIKAKLRRREQDVDLPWAARPGDEEDGRLFRSRNISSRGAAAAINSSQQRDLHGRALTSDRELGVLSRTVGLIANNSRYNLHDHPIPGSHLFSDEPRSELTSEHHVRPQNTLRLLPSHLIDEELAARAIQDDIYSFSGRPVCLRKRSRGHLDDVVDVNPYITPPSESLNMVRNDPGSTSVPPMHKPLVDRLRNQGSQNREHHASWDRLPTPGRDQLKEDIEPWAASFKASLLNAFNAFASGLKSHDSVMEDEHDHDKLTKVPTRRRLSIRNGHRQPFSRRASTKSPAWILHERDDGTGTVQFLPSLEKQYGHGTPMPEQILSLGRDGASDEKGGPQQAERSIYPRVPFLPATAMVRPHHAPSLAKGNPISRDSSFYSTSSLSTPK